MRRSQHDQRWVCNVDRARGLAKFAGGVIVGAILSCSPGFAGQGAHHNGSYWNGLPHLARIAYIEGYADAMQTSIGKLQSLGVAAELLHWKGSKKIVVPRRPRAKHFRPFHQGPDALRGQSLFRPRRIRQTRRSRPDLL
jgi:hypothetical protein